MRTALFTLLFLALVPAYGKLVSEAVSYQHEGTDLEGYCVYDDSISGQRPGVLVVHEWWGLNDYAKRRADQLAEMGYVAFALDMYGKGKATTDRSEAGKLAGQFKGKPLIRTRSQAGLDVLAKQPLVDTSRMAAIGFCFGGTTVLELAFSGAPLEGVVSFHGGLPDIPAGEKTGAKVLVLTGADDPGVPPAKVEAFEETLRKADADWQVVSYGNAVHAFTNPAAGNDPSRGAAYNEKAAKRSWQHMQDFFKEIFSQ